jgi:hypothetical protein
VGCGWASLQCSCVCAATRRRCMHAVKSTLAGARWAEHTARAGTCSARGLMEWRAVVSPYDWGCTSVYLEAKRSVNVSMISYERSRACCLGACEVRSTGVRHTGQLCASCCSSCWAHALVQARQHRMARGRGHSHYARRALRLWVPPEAHRPGEPTAAASPAPEQPASPPRQLASLPPEAASFAAAAAFFSCSSSCAVLRVARSSASTNTAASRCACSARCSAAVACSENTPSTICRSAHRVTHDGGPTSGVVLSPHHSRLLGSSSSGQAARLRCTDPGRSS